MNPTVNASLGSVIINNVINAIAIVPLAISSIKGLKQLLIT